VRVLVEAQCLTWVEVDLEEAYVVAVRIHAVPENLSVPQAPDVVAVDPEKLELVTPAIRTTAISIAANSQMPIPFDVMV
jgi:hypothetical protein